VIALAQKKEYQFLSTYDEIARTNWWEGMKTSDQQKALELVGGKPDEAGIITAWNHYKALREAELSRHPSSGMPIPK
jgi:hypothetical protein